MSMGREMIELISVKTERNSNGYPVTTEVATSCVAVVKSVKYTEYYEALRAGVEPTVIFEIFRYDYSGQKFVDWNGVRYRVIRAYLKPDDFAELTCEEEKSHEHSQ